MQWHRPNSRSAIRLLLSCGQKRPSTVVSADKAAYVRQRPMLRQVLLVPGAEDALSEAGGVRCYQLRGPRIPFDPSYRFLLATRTTRRLVEHERPDLIDVGSPWFVPWVARRANRRLAAPAVWFYHTHFPAIIGSGRAGTPAWRRRAGQAAWTYARQLAIRHRAVLVASDCVAAELEREGVANVIRIRLGVDLDTFHPWPALPWPAPGAPAAAPGGPAPAAPAEEEGLHVIIHEPILYDDLLIRTDLLVLSAGIVAASTNESLSKMLKVPLNADGFFLEAHMKLRPVDFSTEGIFLAGLAHHPKSIDESLSQALHTLNCDVLATKIAARERSRETAGEGEQDTGRNRCPA